MTERGIGRLDSPARFLGDLARDCINSLHRDADGKTVHACTQLFDNSRNCILHSYNSLLLIAVLLERLCEPRETIARIAKLAWCKPCFNDLFLTASLRPMPRREPARESVLRGVFVTTAHRRSHVRAVACPSAISRINVGPFPGDLVRLTTKASGDEPHLFAIASPPTFTQAMTSSPASRMYSSRNRSSCWQSACSWQAGFCRLPPLLPQGSFR